MVISKAQALRLGRIMLVTEIFKSIQGESTFAGLPCIFIRLTGCNLRCHWCDTAYAFYGGTQMSAEEVFARVLALGRSCSPKAASSHHELVEFTGGEPLLQEKEVVPLARQFLAAGYRVLIETSGERFAGGLPKPVVKIMDVKCPASGESGKFCLENLEVLERKDQMKFVIQDENDYRYAREFLAEHGLANRVGEIIFSPVFGRLEPKKLAEWILRDALQVRLGLQLHKFIWDPEARGV
jgi:7-carboxy-7-deazaguanine synthase